MTQIILILPIGPPGSGKTTLSLELKKKYKNLIYISRDLTYKNFRENNGIKKSRFLTHQYIKNKLESVKEEYRNEKYIIVYVDTTNSNEGIRNLYINYTNPSYVRYICFKNNSQTKLYNILEKRVKNRIHPTFKKENTKEIINKIINSIEYPCDNNTINITVDDNQNFNSVFSFLSDFSF